jgi:glutamine synthetase
MTPDPDLPVLPDTIELIVPDMSGIPRGKVIEGASFDPDHPPHIPAAIFFQTLTGEYVDAIKKHNSSDADVIFEPDWETLRPWGADPERRGQVMCTTRQKSGEPLAYDPRNVLRRLLDRYAEAGLSPVIAPEAEFYLLTPGTSPEQPFETAAGRHGMEEHGGEAFSIDALAKYRTFVEAVNDRCRDAGIALSGIVHEMGAAQLELNLHHGPALDRIDQLFMLKRIVKAAAISHGMVASFLSKPFDDLPGSGLHMHVSVYRGEDNVFALQDGRAGDTLIQFIGGLQHYLPEAFALIAPNVNSYKRFVPGLAAPINLEWGYDNRTAGFRVPYGDDAAGRVENRITGADANPYLAAAATLGCGLLGMEQHIAPSEPTASYAYDRPADLPQDLGAALTRLGKSKAMENLFGGQFLEIYRAVKTEELISFSAEVTPWERRFLGAEI